ncbi:uncharacterized protein TNCV_2171121 [Trichonephila clavipes]|nr:uncharacterized protein TNCV_2171121 [Trichonephila clavipes]
MAKFSYLPENKRYKIIHLKEEGYSTRQIAAKVPCGLSTVVRTLKKFSETNFIADRGRSGRPRKTSLRENRLFLSNRKLNSSQILKQWTLTSNVSVCPRTVRRLLEIGLRGCKARPKPLLTEFQRKRRLTWAREHSLWTIKDWEKPLVSEAHSKVPDKSEATSVSKLYGTHSEVIQCSRECLKQGLGIHEESCQVIYSQFGLAIHQNDHQARRRFVEWAQNQIAVGPDFHKRILFSDEAHFWLNGYVNKQNCRICSEANPQVYVETPLHPEKLTVWGVLWACGILLQKR